MVASEVKDIEEIFLKNKTIDLNFCSVHERDQ